MARAPPAMASAAIARSCVISASRPTNGAASSTFGECAALSVGVAADPTLAPDGPEGPLSPLGPLTPDGPLGPDGPDGPETPLGPVYLGVGHSSSGPTNAYLFLGTP